jgi:hypothetical protein
MATFRKALPSMLVTGLAALKITGIRIAVPKIANPNLSVPRIAVRGVAVPGFDVVGRLSQNDCFSGMALSRIAVPKVNISGMASNP